MWGGRKLAVGTGAETAGKTGPSAVAGAALILSRAGLGAVKGEGSSAKPQTVTFVILSY